MIAEDKNDGFQNKKKVCKSKEEYTRAESLIQNETINLTTKETNGYTNADE